MNTAQANERVARAGYTSRLARWGVFRAAVRDELYDELTHSWWQQQEADGTPVLSRDRRPLVQLGEAARIVDQTFHALTGTDTAPVLEVYQGDDENADSGTDDAKMVATVLEKGLGLPGALKLPTLDLLGGSCIFAFSRPDDRHPERHDWIRLQPEWCDAVWAPQAKSAKARAYAQELAELGLEMPEDDRGKVYLPVPEGAGRHDLIFLRHQVKIRDEVSTGVGSRTEWRYERTDYLPDVIVPYLSVPTTERNDTPPRGFVIDGELAPHDWGVVPAVWLREWTAEPDELDGRSLLRPSILSMAKQADYVASFAATAVNRNADPDVVEIDVEREEELAALDLGLTLQRRTTGGRTWRYRSMGGSHQGRVELLETQGAASEASRELFRLLRQSISDNSGVIRHDPERASGAQSGEAMRRFLRPFIQLLDAYRAVIEEGLTQLVRLVAHVLRVEGEIKAEDIGVTVNWPDVVPMTPSDAQAWAQVGAQLVAAGYPQEEIVLLLATKLGHPDAEEVARSGAAEAEARMQAAKDAAAARQEQQVQGAQGQQEQHPPEPPAPQQ